jgi:CRP-like cAMP-binding protein
MFGNDLLDHIAEACSHDLRGRLKPVDYIHGDTLAEPDAAIETLVFPRSGVISIVVEPGEDEEIEAGMIGRHGALGCAAIMGATYHPHKAVCQISGRGWKMTTADARHLAEKSAEFRRLLIAHELYLLAQARQFAACNARHFTIQRLCSWLLRAQDEIGGAELAMTQDTFAKMLGVQRASISLLAGQLQQDDLISYRRGRIRVTDAQGLRARACACHDALREQRERLFRKDNSQGDHRAGERGRERPTDGSWAG